MPWKRLTLMPSAEPPVAEALREKAVLPPAHGWTCSQTWLLVGGTLVTVALLFSPIRFSVDREFWERLMDAAHVPFFAGFTLFVSAVLPLRWGGPSRRVHLGAGIAALTAAAVELIQPYTGRGESFTDLCNGLLGVALAVGGWHVWKRLDAWRWIHAALMAVVMLYVLQPAWRQFRGLLWRSTHFPLLGDFENNDELRIWRASDDDNGGEARTTIGRSEEQASRGTHSLRIDTVAAAWPGARLQAGDADWRAWRTFAFDVFNPGESLTLSLRIDDDKKPQAHAEHYNGAFPLRSGWNRIAIPLEEIARGPAARPLRLQKIRQVIFFLDAPKESRTLYLDHVRLQ